MTEMYSDEFIHTRLLSPSHFEAEVCWGVGTMLCVLGVRTPSWVWTFS